MFGGDITLSFLQQVCAATVSGVQLDYSTFRDDDTARELTRLLALAEGAGATVGTLTRTLLSHREGARSFFEHVSRTLDGG